LLWIPESVRPRLDLSQAPISSKAMDTDLKNSESSRAAYRLFILRLLDTQAQREDLATLTPPSYVEYLATIYKPASPKAAAVDTPAVEAKPLSPKVPKVLGLHAPLPPPPKDLDPPEGGDSSPPPFGMSARLGCHFVVLRLTF
jgi:hypothetical protein